MPKLSTATHVFLLLLLVWTAAARLQCTADPKGGYRVEQNTRSVFEGRAVALHAGGRWHAEATKTLHFVQQRNLSASDRIG